MAEIPVSTIVNVSITTTPVAPSRAGFGTLLLVTQEAGVIGTDEVRTYASIDEVVDDWADTTEVYAAATTYFSQSPRPTTLAVGYWDVTTGDPETVEEALNRFNDLADWYAFAFTKETRDNSDVEDASAWAEARVKQLFTTTNDATAIVSGSGGMSDIAYTLNALEYRRTFVIYQDVAEVDEYPEVSAFARAATTVFSNGTDTVITLKFKQLPGITPVALTSAQLNILKAKGCNAYVTIGGVNILTEGIMVAGVGVYQDAVHGIDWLQNAIETNVYAYLVTRTTKVPLTDAGAASIEQQVINALEESVRNGLVAPGTTTDGVFLSKGYTTSVGKVADLDISSRQQRICPPISFTAIGAGAIHSVQISGVFEG